MALSKVEITNLGKFQRLTVENLGGVVLIEGGNGTGKTSLLDAIQYIGARGHDPDIIHGNADFGEVQVTFTDGNMARARATRSPAETVRGWKPKDGKRWIMNRDQIDAIYSAISYNPLSFLDLPEAKQAEELLRMTATEVPADEITAIVAPVQEEASAVSFPPNPSALDVITATHKALYDARRGVNGAVDTLAKYIAQSEAILPPPPENGDWGSEAKRIQSDLDEFNAGERKLFGQIDASLSQRVNAAKDKHRQDSEAVDADIDGKIRALEVERSQRKTAIAEAAAVEQQDLVNRATKKKQEVAAQNSGPREALTKELATAQERARAQQQAEGARKQIEEARQQLEQKKAKSQALTAALDGLADLKTKLVAKVKIAGGFVEGGRVVREEDGGLVPLKKWNTESQIRFCLSLGIKANWKAGFVCLDDAEHFDEQKRPALIKTAEKYAKESGIQFIIASATSGEMKVVSK